MKTKAKIKWTLDVLMTAALFFLMGYQFWGEAAHEWIGAGMFVLFIAHQICNLNWYKNLFRGRYTPVRILQCMINVLTLAAMLALMYSGITMSRHVFAFLPVRGGMALARRLHILGSYWGYLLMSLHLGLHWGMVLNMVVIRHTSQHNYQAAGFITGLLIAVYGVYVFIKRNFFTYMFLRSEFVFLDYEEPKIKFFLDYLALMGLCIFIAHYLAKLVRKAGNGRKGKFMRKIAVCLLAAAFMLTVSGCGGSSDSPAGQETEQDGTGQNGNDAAAQETLAADEGTFSDQNGQKEHTVQDSDVPVVYMTTDLSAEGLMAVYEALEASPSGNIAIKLSTGEPGSNYLRTDLIGTLVQSFDNPTIVECNTAYGGSRANTAMHYQVAEEHGYTAIAAVDIMDEYGSMTLAVEGGDNLTENYVGAGFANYDYYVILSHFKGHAMAGFGGAVKNISIGIASADGKAHIHSGGTDGNLWGGDQDAFLESMAEAGKSVVDYLDGNILYINVMNRLSVDCDCDGNPAEPDMHDIGILASFDPVALDQACVDLVYAAEDGQSLIDRIESRNGLHTLEQAEKIGLGSREYQLVNIDG